MKKQTNNADQDKKYLQALQASDERFRSIVVSSPDAIIVTDAKGMIEYMNPAAEKVFNRKLESFIGKDFGLTLVNGESTEMDIIRPGKDPGVGDMYVVETEWLGEKAHLITIRDITKRKQAEEALRESEEKYRWMLDNMADVITLMDMNLRFTYVSPSIIRMRGYTAEEATAQTFEQVMTPESLQISAKVFEEEMRLEASGTADPDRVRIVVVEQYRKDGSTVWMENSLSFMRDKAQKKPVGIISVSRDITERKQAEEALKTERQRLHDVLETMPVMVCLLTPDYHVAFANRAFREQFGESHGRRCYEYCFGGQKEPCDFCETYRVLKTAKPHHWQVTTQDGASVIDVYDFPFTDVDGSPMILEVNIDITERKQAEEKLKDTLESLRKALNSTIQAMVSAVEARDPYTSGHQIRSANLARLIAKEMGLSPEKIEGIRVAGSIHDIGKLSIPAEILSKPTKLSEIEFSLIKEHARKGYEMLKDVESPWPLAEIVYEHHERMDGSGYPRNLKGDEILMEARIMAVADVVEAMASHRPYRPALGIDAALEEIEKNSGTVYDSTVVAACLRLFREKGFQLQ